IGQEVEAAVNIGIFIGIGVRHRVDHGLRLLGGGAVVEVDERLAVDRAGQDREVTADRLDIVRCAIDYLVHRLTPCGDAACAYPCLANQPCSFSSSASTRGSSSSSSMTSATNALTRRPRAA